MAINSSKSKTGLLTVLQQDQDLRPSWNIYHPRWSGEEVAMHTTLTGAPGWWIQTSSVSFATSNSFPQPLRVQRGIILSSICLKATVLQKWERNRRSMSWAITREKGELNYRDRAVRIHRLESACLTCMHEVPRQAPCIY